MELQDGGGGALAVGVLEEALGVVIQVVVLETGSKGAESTRSGGCYTHATRRVSGRGMRMSMAARSIEHGACRGMGHGRGSAVQRTAGQSRAEHLDCRKKRTASPERAVTRRAEGKDVSSARAWPNLRNFGQRRTDGDGRSQHLCTLWTELVVSQIELRT